MTDQLPEVAWLVVEPEWQDGDGNPLVGGEWEGHDFTGKGTLFLRADTAIPRAEADAMVAAALEKAAEKCAIIDHTPGENVKSRKCTAPISAWGTRICVMRGERRWPTLTIS